MVIAHSTSFGNYGLQYQDATDVFRFISNGNPVFNVNLGNSTIQYPHTSAGANKVLSSDAAGNATWDYALTPTKSQVTSMSIGTSSGVYTYGTAAYMTVTPAKSGTLNIEWSGSYNCNQAYAHQVVCGLKVTTVNTQPSPSTSFDAGLTMGNAIGYSGAAFGNLPFTVLHSMPVTQGVTYYIWIGTYGSNYNNASTSGTVLGQSGRMTCTLNTSSVL